MIDQREFPFNLPTPANPSAAGMVQAAPNRFVPRDATVVVPEAILCDLVANGDGTFRLEPRVYEKMIRLDWGVVRSLGLNSYDTLYRLGRAGFIELVKVAPGTTLLNLQSWLNHLRRCAEDPFFWEGKNGEHYRENYQ